MSRFAAIACILASLLAPASLRSQTFTDVWSSAGFSSDEATQGVALGDFDGDGATDVFLTSIFVDNPIPFLPDLGGPNRCYANNGSAAFSDRAPLLGLDDSSQAQGAAWADYDNDGRLDLYVVRGLQQAIAQSHLLYRQGAASFDPSPSSWVSSAKAGRSVCWADHDNDGDLDVFVTNGIDSSDFLPDARVYLFRNNADGSFTDVTVALGLADTRNGHGCAWSDYDNDGDMDLYVANKGFEDPVLGLSDPQANALYRNQLVETGAVGFLDVAVAAGVTGIDPVDPGGSSFGATWADYNNDGWMDLYVTNGFSGLIPFPTPNRLYLNRGDGTFTDVTLLAFLGGLSTEPSYSSTWGDYDNDGDLDLYVTNAAVPFLVSARNHLYVNRGAPFFLFEDNAQAAGVAVEEFAQACAAADFNRDGYLDIYSINGVPAVELFFENADNLFLNAGGTNHWLELDLVGVISNRSAVGARVTLDARGREQTREVSAGQGYQSMDDLRVELGLGTATVADAVTIRWPSGCIQRLEQIAADQMLQVVESCIDRILRAELAGPVAGLFPLPGYRAVNGSTWDDPEPVLGGARSYFYQHSGSVVVKMTKAGTTVRLGW